MLATVVTVSVEELLPPAVNVTLIGFSVAVGPLLTTGYTLAVRLTVPVKPPKLVAVIVEVPDEPAATSMVEVLEEMRNPTTVAVTVVECVRDPLVPVTVIV